jgi:hypothetical protein
MQSSSPISDLNGPLHYWGPARYALPATPAPRVARPTIDDSAPFGDLSGPLAYWGPAPVSTSRLARVA